MLPTRRPTNVAPRFGAGAALLSGPAVVEIEAATLLLLALPAVALAATVAVVEVLALVGVFAWTVALAVLVGLFCVRAGQCVRRWRRPEDRGDVPRW